MHPPFYDARTVPTASACSSPAVRGEAAPLLVSAAAAGAGGACLGAGACLGLRKDSTLVLDPSTLVAGSRPTSLNILPAAVRREHVTVSNLGMPAELQAPCALLEHSPEGWCQQGCRNNQKSCPWRRRGLHARRACRQVKPQFNAMLVVYTWQLRQKSCHPIRKQPP